MKCLPESKESGSPSLPALFLGLRGGDRWQAGGPMPAPQAFVMQSLVAGNEKIQSRACSTGVVGIPTKGHCLATSCWVTNTSLMQSNNPAGFIDGEQLLLNTV